MLLALGVSRALQIAAIAVFGSDNPAAMAGFLCVMWSPTVLALVYIRRHPIVRAQVLWRLGRPAWLPLGVVVQAGIGFAVVAILVVAGLATSGWFDFSANAVAISGGPWLLGQGMQGWPRGPVSPA
ncbi:hypothetical protein [Luteimonas kalidii]|uniref:Uncharacterized protein n=1 Tax=Luteimonas kalidii TaxID=3042025 RepID=A0ABT6JQ57_9GAMM|nr:hypothetical protein [Luteimonas kalidii]MDH5832810.1 hypothetical protein [Luteimonas kalidii]